MFTSDSQFSRYQAMVSHLAEAAFDMSEQPGPLVLSRDKLTVALPAVHALRSRQLLAASRSALHSAIGLLAQSDGRLVTLTHQTRPVYHPLAAHLLLRALAHHRAAHTPRQWAEAQAHVVSLAARLEPVAPARDTVAQVLWQALCQWEAGELLEDASQVEDAARRVEALLATSPAAGSTPAPLHAQRTDDQLDHWTYRELSGLHALANLALRTGRDDWWAAAERVVDFHMEHTQPDYTTCEPWGVHAFLHRPATLVFAEQQMHDTQTNLHLGGPSVGLLPALLLTDAAHAMAAPGFGAAWQSDSIR